MRIVVAGIMGSYPVAGLVSHYLQYILGLEKLGHTVHYLEDTGWLFDPWSGTYADQWNLTNNRMKSLPASKLEKVKADHGLKCSWTYVGYDAQVYGTSITKLQDILNDADLFINVSGACQIKDEYKVVPIRAFVDTDPGRIQMRSELDPEGSFANGLRWHNKHYTFGCNQGSPGCTIPNVGYKWYPTVQPIDLDLWPVASKKSEKACFSTVMKWKPYESIIYLGRTYGMKDIEFEKFRLLPKTISRPIEIAMEGKAPQSIGKLNEIGWHTRNALEISGNLTDYRNYIHTSRAEWSVAKNCYVATNSGWFSERTAVYLASGRPAVVQDTGFSEWLPTGQGLLAFSNMEEATRALEFIDADYEKHCKSAREIAENYFDSSKVLNKFLNDAQS